MRNFLDPELVEVDGRERVLFHATCGKGVRGALISGVHADFAYDPEQEVLISDVSLRVRTLQPDFWNFVRRVPLWHAEAEVVPLALDAERERST